MIKRLLPLFLLFGCSQEVTPPPIRPVRAMQLQQETLVPVHVFPGRTRAVDRVNLSFRVSGPLIERPVKVGDRVNAGDLLARIDPRDFQVALERAQGNLEKTQAELRFAKSDYQRAMRIWKQDPGAISESQLERKKEDVGQLEGTIQSLEAEVNAARDRLEDTYLLSPYEGTVVATYVENFEYVEARQPIVRLLDQSQVEMVIDVPARLITEIPQAQAIEVAFETIPGRTFPAELREVGTEASTTTRTYPVTLVLDQPSDVTILAGMAGTASMSSRSETLAERGFVIPSTALMTDPSGTETFVWIYEPETESVARRTVLKGKLIPQGVVILDGLEAGEWVVTSGVLSLSEGEQVKLLPVELSATGEQIELYPEPK